MFLNYFLNKKYNWSELEYQTHAIIKINRKEEGQEDTDTDTTKYANHGKSHETVPFHSSKVLCANFSLFFSLHMHLHCVRLNSVLLGNHLPAKEKIMVSLLGFDCLTARCKRVLKAGP